MKPIKISQDYAKNAAQKLYEQLMAMNYIRSDKFTYSAEFPAVKQKNAITVNFTYEAYHQMFALINHFSSEVAWCGTVNRIDETHFQITKILLYPQTVTGATVNTDWGEYSMWYAKLPDEDFNNLHFQGHSHVNMGVTPSGTDMEDQWRFIDTMPMDSYEIFMIWNKRREYNVRVIDLKANVIYEGEDVNVTVGDFDSSRFLENADQIVKNKIATTPVYGATGNWTGNTGYSANAIGSNGGYSAGGAGASKVYGSTVTYPKTPLVGTKKEESKKTVTGSAAPKVPAKSNLAKYYEEHPEELEAVGNSSCWPYYNDIDAFQG